MNNNQENGDQPTTSETDQIVRKPSLSPPFYYKHMLDDHNTIKELLNQYDDDNCYLSGQNNVDQVAPPQQSEENLAVNVQPQDQVDAQNPVLHSDHNNLHDMVIHQLEALRREAEAEAEMNSMESLPMTQTLPEINLSEGQQSFMSHLCQALFSQSGKVTFVIPPPNPLASLVGPGPLILQQMESESESESQQPQVDVNHAEINQFLPQNPTAEMAPLLVEIANFTRGQQSQMEMGQVNDNAPSEVQVVDQQINEIDPGQSPRLIGYYPVYKHGNQVTLKYEVNDPLARDLGQGPFILKDDNSQNVKLTTIEQLTQLEARLECESYRDEFVSLLENLGVGADAEDYEGRMKQILAHFMDDSLAQFFSWKGTDRPNKYSIPKKPFEIYKNIISALIDAAITMEVKSQLSLQKAHESKRKLDKSIKLWISQAPAKFKKRMQRKRSQEEAAAGTPENT